MGAKTIRELLVSIGVKADEKDLKKFDAALEATKSGMAGLGKLALGIAGGIAAIGTGLFVAADSAASYADELDEASDRTGVATGTLQELRYAADLAGISAEELDSAMAKQARSTQDAIGGSKDAAAAFTKLGISQSELKDLSKDQGKLFEEIAGGLMGITNEQEQIDLVMSIFGRGGARLLPLLKSGKMGIKELRAEAQRLGIVMDEGSIAAGREFKDALDNMGYAVQGLKNSLGTALLPVLTKLMTRFKDWFQANRAVMQQGIDKWAKRLSAGFEKVVYAVGEVDKVISRTTGWLPVLTALTGAVGFFGAAWAALTYGGPVVTGIMAIVDGLIALGAAAGVAGGGLAAFTAGGLVIGFIATVIGVLVYWAALITAQFAAMYLVFQDVFFFLEGKKSLVGEFVDQFAKAEGPLGLFSQNIQNAKRLILGLVDVFWPLANVLSITLPWALGVFADAVVIAFQVATFPIVTFAKAMDWMFGLTDKFNMFVDLGNRFYEWAPPLRLLAYLLETITDQVVLLGPYLDMLFGKAENMDDIKVGTQTLFGDAIQKISPALGSLGGLGGMAAQAFAPTAEAIFRGDTASNSTNTKSINQPVNVTINGSADEGTMDRLSGLFDKFHRNTAAVFSGGEI